MMPDKYVDFNINWNVRVRLTDFGKEILRKQHAELLSVFPGLTMEFMPPCEDKDGWSEWQLWKLMETFGEYVGMGRIAYPFELNIQIALPNPKEGSGE